MGFLVDDTTEQVVAHRSGYQYSAAKIDNLGSDRYTLVDIRVDGSGSVTSFKNLMEGCIRTIVKDCYTSPEANNLLVRITSFSNEVKEIHGYKELCNINPDVDYVNFLNPSGNTACIDAMYESNEAALDFAKRLKDSKYTVNGFELTITDGWDNWSIHTTDKVRRQSEEKTSGEHMESNLSILIGVNIQNTDIALKLQTLKDEAGIMQFEKLEDATEGTFSRIAGFVRKSISSQSVSLGTGKGSQPLKF